MDDSTILTVDDLIPAGRTVGEEVARIVATDPAAGTPGRGDGRMYLWNYYLSDLATRSLDSLTCRRGCGPELSPLLTPVAHPAGLFSARGLDFIFDAAVDTLTDSLTSQSRQTLEAQCLSDLLTSSHRGGCCLHSHVLVGLVPLLIGSLTGTAAALIASDDTPGAEDYLDGLYDEYAHTHPAATGDELVDLVTADPRVDAIPDTPSPVLHAVRAGGWCDEQYLVAPDVLELAMVGDYPVNTTGRGIVAVSAWVRQRGSTFRPLRRD